MLTRRVASRSSRRATTSCSTPRAARRIAFAIATRELEPCAMTTRPRSPRRYAPPYVSGSRRSRMRRGRGSDEEPAEPPARCRLELGAQRLEDAPDRSLERLQRDVPREPVRDDDVRVALEQPPALGVPRERERARAQELVRLQRELVSLLVLLADRQQPDLGLDARRGSRARRPRPCARTGAGARAARRRSRRRR